MRRTNLFATSDSARFCLRTVGRLKSLHTAFHSYGVPICADTTLASPLSGQGTPTHRSDVVLGAALANAERREARTYPELVGRGRARLVVLGCEVGGRQRNEALATVPLLAAHRASSAPELLRPSVIHACLPWLPKARSPALCVAMPVRTLGSLRRPPSPWESCGTTGPTTRKGAGCQPAAPPPLLRWPSALLTRLGPPGRRIVGRAGVCACRLS